MASTSIRLARAGGDSSLLVQHVALLALRYPWLPGQGGNVARLVRIVLGVYGTLSAAAYGATSRKRDAAVLEKLTATPVAEFFAALFMCAGVC